MTMTTLSLIPRYQQSLLWTLLHNSLYDTDALNKAFGTQWARRDENLYYTTGTNPYRSRAKFLRYGELLDYISKEIPIHLQTDFLQASHQSSVYPNEIGVCLAAARCKSHNVQWHLLETALEEPIPLQHSNLPVEFQNSTINLSYNRTACLEAPTCTLIIRSSHSVRLWCCPFYVKPEVTAPDTLGTIGLAYPVGSRFTALAPILDDIFDAIRQTLNGYHLPYGDLNGAILTAPLNCTTPA